MIVKHPRINWTSVLLAVIASAQVLTLGMVGHIYYRVQRVASAFSALPSFISKMPEARPGGRADRSTETPQARAAVIPRAPETRRETFVKPITLESIDTRPTEQNSTWWRYAWVATLSNSSSEQQTFRLKIQWLDDSNFVIDDTTTGTLSIAPGASDTFTGYDLITAGGPAERVAKVKAFIQ